jgi:hypothetical protein
MPHHLSKLSYTPESWAVRLLRDPEQRSATGVK